MSNQPPQCGELQQDVEVMNTDSGRTQILRAGTRYTIIKYDRVPGGNVVHFSNGPDMYIATCENFKGAWPMSDQPIPRGTRRIYREKLDEGTLKFRLEVRDELTEEYKTLGTGAHYVVHKRTVHLSDINEGGSVLDTIEFSSGPNVYTARLRDFIEATEG